MMIWKPRKICLPMEMLAVRVLFVFEVQVDVTVQLAGRSHGECSIRVSQADQGRTIGAKPASLVVSVAGLRLGKWVTNVPELTLCGGKAGTCRTRSCKLRLLCNPASSWAKGRGDRRRQRNLWICLRLSFFRNYRTFTYKESYKEADVHRTKSRVSAPSAFYYGCIRWQWYSTSYDVVGNPGHFLARSEHIPGLELLQLSARNL